MRKALFAIIAASAVAFTVVCLPPATNSLATSCDDVKFIFARGSGQTINDEDYLAYQTSIGNELLQQKSNLKVGFYELGSSSEYGAKYPAVSLDFLTILGAKVSAGNAFSFSESVKQGITELKNYTEAISVSCPGTRFVVAGYSQGAMLISNGLNELNADKFIYAATFGDPKLYLPEGEGADPDACRGENLSPYRIFAPNCRTYQGSLDAKIPYLEDAWQDKVGLWCKDQDLVCGAGFSFGEPKTETDPLGNIVQSALHAHTRYPDDGIYNIAAKTIIEKLQSAYPDRFNNASTILGNCDTVILFDTSGSMYQHMNYHKKIALEIAEKTIKYGGRIALYTFGDVKYRRAEQVLDFTADLDKFTAYLYSLGSMLDGDGDRKNSYLSATLDVLNSLNWNADATKSIITLTITPARNPDRDGTTEAKVRQRTLEIDPVNLYLASENGEIASSYQDIITSTGGKIFSATESPADYLVSRPSVAFPLAAYSAKPGEKLTFSANPSGNIIKYEWDLNFDGIFETTTNEPTLTTTYPSDTSGYLQLRATDQNDLISTASAYVNISSIKTLKPSLKNLKVNQNGTNVSINYQFGENTIGALIALDDALLGISTANNLEITNVVKNTTLTLTPIGQDGTFGTPLGGKILFSSNDTPYAPQTGRQ